MSYYENHLGVSFGFTPIIADGTEYPGETGTVVGWTTRNHSFRNLGLYPRSKPKISAPEIQTITFDVPGRDGLIDASESLDGEVHFKNRKGVFEYTQTGGRDTWDKTYHMLKNNIHGRNSGLVVDEEQDGYYIGRFFVEEPEYDSKRGIAYFTITADLEPYKRSWTRSWEPWLWDPFSFQYGVISDITERTHIAEPGPVSLVQWTLIGNRQPVVPHFYMEKDPLIDYTEGGGDGKPHINLSYYKDGDTAHTTTIRMVEGDNVDLMPELLMHQNSVYTIKMWGEEGDPNGVGYVWAEYREGWL